MILGYVATVYAVYYMRDMVMFAAHFTGFGGK